MSFISPLHNVTTFLNLVHCFQTNCSDKWHLLQYSQKYYTKIKFKKNSFTNLTGWLSVVPFSLMIPMIDWWLIVVLLVGLSPVTSGAGASKPWGPVRTGRFCGSYSRGTARRGWTPNSAASSPERWVNYLPPLPLPRTRLPSTAYTIHDIITGLFTTFPLYYSPHSHWTIYHITSHNSSLSTTLAFTTFPFIT